MYNTVGETAGVTQDVGSDPTVGPTATHLFHFCCLCGAEVEREDQEEEVDEDEEIDELDEGYGSEIQKERKAEGRGGFSLAEMSQMEEDEEMEGEEDVEIENEVEHKEESGMTHSGVVGGGDFAFQAHPVPHLSS